jgi:hypothetical protein
MPILIFILLAVLIAQIGFWDTLSGILGAAAMLLLFVVFGVALLALIALLFFRRMFR